MWRTHTHTHTSEPFLRTRDSIRSLTLQTERCLCSSWDVHIGNGVSTPRERSVVCAHGMSFHRDSLFVVESRCSPSSSSLSFLLLPSPSHSASCLPQAKIKSCRRLAGVVPPTHIHSNYQSWSQLHFSQSPGNQPRLLDSLHC